MINTIKRCNCNCIYKIASIYSIKIETENARSRGAYNDVRHRAHFACCTMQLLSKSVTNRSLPQRLLGKAECSPARSCPRMCIGTLDSPRHPSPKKESVCETETYVYTHAYISRGGISLYNINF